MKNKKWLFGWTNIRKFILEFIKIYSNDKSFFSKKRIESSVAFVIGQWGMIYYLIKSIDNMSTTDITIWAGVEFCIAGYIIHEIEKNKVRDNKQKGVDNTEEFLNDENNEHKN
jgi:hypothetical protein